MEIKPPCGATTAHNNPLPSPTDGITSLIYLHNLLACTSWDGTIRIYDDHRKADVTKKSLECSLLSLAASIRQKTVYSGGIDGSIHRLDVDADKLSSLGPHRHDDPMKRGVSCLKSICDSSLLVSAGWNGVFHLWDVRAGSAAAAVA
jgi:WD40 repeat protein